MGHLGPRIPPADVVCLTCGGAFKKHQCRIASNPRHFCTRECYRRSLVGHVQREETRKRRSVALSGENSPTWNGGRSRQYKRGYKSERFKRWRSEVFARDRHTCQKCGQHGGYLTAHHIKPFARFPELRYDVSNGRTLCEPCHSAEDNYYARFHPNTRKEG